MSKPSCHHRSEELQASAMARLKASGLKLTPIRKSILEYLIHSHGPFTIEQIFEFVSFLKCNLVSVYRTLSSLEAAGLVRKYEVGDRMARYEYLCAEHPHHHLICTRCKKIVVVDLDIVSKLKKLANKKGFAEVNSSVDFFGICLDCAK